MFIFLLGIASVSCQKGMDIPEEIASQQDLNLLKCEAVSVENFNKSSQVYQLNNSVHRINGQANAGMIDLDQDGTNDVQIVLESFQKENVLNEVLKLIFLNNKWYAHYSVKVENMLFCDNPGDGYRRISYYPNQQNISCSNLPYEEGKKKTYISRLSGYPDKNANTWTNSPTIMATTVNEFYEEDYYYRYYHTGLWFGEGGDMVFRKETNGKYEYALVNLCIESQIDKEKNLKSFHINKVDMRILGKTDNL